MIKKTQIEERIITKPIEIKYTYKAEICDKEALERYFHKRFQQLNEVYLINVEPKCLKKEKINSNEFVYPKKFREKNTFERDGRILLNYTLVNLKAWHKKDFDVIEGALLSQIKSSEDNAVSGRVKILGIRDVR